MSRLSNKDLARACFSAQTRGSNHNGSFTFARAYDNPDVVLIYSYRTPVAAVVPYKNPGDPNAPRRPTLVVTSLAYSVTTTRHVGLILSAASGNVDAVLEAADLGVPSVDLQPEDIVAGSYGTYRLLGTSVYAPSTVWTNAGAALSMHGFGNSSTQAWVRQPKTKVENFKSRVEAGLDPRELFTPVTLAVSRVNDPWELVLAPYGRGALVLARNRAPDAEGALCSTTPISHEPGKAYRVVKCQDGEQLRLHMPHLQGAWFVYKEKPWQ